MTRTPLRFVLVAVLGCGGTTPASSPPVAPQANVKPPVSGGGAASGGCAPIPWQDDMNAGEATYQGKLDRIEAGLPNGEMEKALLVFLDTPACLPAGGDEKQTSEIQVYSPDPALEARLEALVGKAVVVTGEGFTAHTAHHHRPIVVDVKRVSTK